MRSLFRPNLRPVACACALSVALVAGLAQAQRPTPSPPAHKLYVGGTLDASTRGASYGASVAYALTPAFELSAHAAMAGTRSTQNGCLAYDLDSIALLTLSRFYFGEGHREANFDLRQRGEASLGALVRSPGRLSFVSSVRAGVRWLGVTAEVDEVVSREARARWPFFGCGTDTRGAARHTGARELERPASFATAVTGAFAVLGAGVGYHLPGGWRLDAQLQSRHYFYGDTGFRIRDPRAPGRGSVVLPVRRSAPATQYVARLAVSAPLR